METKFNFKSAICTSREQSEKLLALGLKKETADMCWTKMAAIRGTFYVPELAPINMVPWRHTPAWSLGRLLEICGEDRLPISFHKKGKVKIRVNHIHPTHDGRSSYNYYDSIIDCIEWLIKEGYFNKEYLV